MSGDLGAELEPARQHGLASSAAAQRLPRRIFGNGGRAVCGIINKFLVDKKREAASIFALIHDCGLPNDCCCAGKH